MHVVSGIGDKLLFSVEKLVIKLYKKSNILNLVSIVLELA